MSLSAKSATAWSSLVEERNSRLHAQARWRHPVTFDARGPVGVLTEDGRPVVAFASNDYLGLSTHPAVTAAAHEALDLWGTGAGASRLVTGSRPCHEALEESLASWKGTERAVVFPTGFAANLGVLSVFGDRGVTILSDELNHASIIDGARLSRGRRRRLPPPRRRPPRSPAGEVHGTVPGRHRRRLLHGRRRRPRRPDRRRLPPPRRPPRPRRGPRTSSAPISDLISPVSTSCGWGRSRRRSDHSVASWPAPAPFVDHLTTAARPYIFTTAPTPADAAAALAALGVVRLARGGRLRARLAAPRRRRVAPRPPEPHHPRRPGQRGPGGDGVGGPAPPRGLGAGHPAAHGAAGDGPPARHPLGRPHRRPGRPAARGAGRGRRAAGPPVPR